MKKIPKYEVVLVVVGAGVAANTRLEDTKYKPDKDYKRVSGVAVHLINPLGDATAPFVSIGLNDGNRGVVHDDAPLENFAASSAVDPNNKFKALNVPCKGQTLRSGVLLNVASGAGFTVAFVYRVEDEEVEVSSSPV